MNGPNYWQLSHAEFQASEIQFIALRPADGFLSGEQARPFFMQSGLPPQTLGQASSFDFFLFDCSLQIWHLADLTHDGKLDRLEFAIAMKLVRNALSGIEMPRNLPESMRVVAPAPPQPLMQPPAYGMPQMMPPPAYAPGQAPPTPLRPLFVMGTKENYDWTIPQEKRLQYAQRFNQLDKNRADFLTGQQLRGVMGESQLPADVLAQIWNFADNNKEGYLTIERFCVAMFLIDKVKEGYALPKTLPPELQAHGPRSQTESPVVPQEPGAPPPQKSPAPKTFEDRRMENLSKGEAELERRREVLRREEEERRRVEMERQERELMLQREREREEQERREAEMELQRQKQREMEEQRAAEEARLRAEREEAQKKAQEERIKLLEARHIADLETELQAEKERTAQIKQRHSTMSFQLQGLEEKAQHLNAEIGGARDEIMSITTEIEGMRKQRDEKIAKIQQLQAKTQEIAVQTERVSHVNLQLQTESQKSLSRGREIEALRTAIADRHSQIAATETAIAEAKQRYANQEKLVAEKRPAYEEGQEKLKKLAELYNSLLQKFVVKQQELHQKVQRKRQQAVPTQELYELPPDTNGQPGAAFGDNFGATFGQDSFAQPSTTSVQPAAMGFGPSGGAPHATGSGKPPVKYRALYEFTARSEDELSLQPGDTILVFEDHVAEEGWKAGQIKTKVGWFPASFAEPVVTKKTTNKQPSLTTSPSTEPLESIKEEPAEKELANDMANLSIKQSVSSGSLKKEEPALNGHSQQHASPDEQSAALPLYDAPPGNEPAAPPPTSAPTPTSATMSSGSGETKEGDGSTTVLATGTASFAWKARKEGELGFARGDRIEILEQKEMRWRGRIAGKNDQTGWFPKSYVKLNEGEADVPRDGGGDAPSVAEGEWYVALYPFDAIEPTDLSLNAGDRIFVTQKTGDWWKGAVGQRSGIFPGNYVEKDEVTTADDAPSVNLVNPVARTSEKSAVASFDHSATSKLQKQIQELIETEARFADELLMIRNVFMKPLVRLVGQAGIDRIFLNFDQLIKVSKRLHSDLLKHPPGPVFCRRIDMLEAFVQFCEQQQGAIAYLNSLERTDSRFRKAYLQCVQNPPARNMSLSYYLLLPMARITRYPLIFESLIKHTPPGDPQYETLSDAHQLLKALCSRVNQAISEMENTNVLCWCTQNIRCDGLNRALEFPSETREVGPREYLHSGVLYKTKSNKMLVAFLFNDFLLLTTPNVPIDNPDSFKVTKELHLRLTMYKQPLMLDSLEVASSIVGSASPAHEDTSFVFKYASEHIQVRAPSRNAKSFWTTQLQKAIDHYDVTTQMRRAMADPPKTPAPTGEQKEIGRLLVEILSITNLPVGMLNLRLKAGLDQAEGSSVDTQIAVREAHNQSLYTTQFSLHSLEQTFHGALFVPMQFRPDVKLGQLQEASPTASEMSAQKEGGRRVSIFCSLLVYVAVFSLVLTALCTDHWFETSTLKRNGELAGSSHVHSGLFHGVRQLDYGMGPRRHPFFVMDEIHRGVSFLDRGTWVWMIFFTGLGFLWTFIALLVALLNVLEGAEARTVIGPSGLYVWSSLACEFLSFTATSALFGWTFGSGIKQNVLLEEHTKDDFSSRNLARQPLIDQLAARAEEYRKELGRHVRAGPEGRRIRSQLSTIQRTIREVEVRRKHLEEMFEVPQKPGLASLEILSNGTTHMLPSVCVRTTKKTYIFNCPEGSSRFMPSLRIRPQPVEDIFVTRGHWDCMGGLLSVLMSKEGDPPVRLHGPRKLKFYLESVRPFADSDTGLTTHQIAMEEIPCDQTKYEDGGLVVHYIPLFPMQLDPSAVLPEESPDRRIDVVKLARLKVPKGPLIKRLKDGHTVTLPDGRVVTPDEVLTEDSNEDVGPHLFVVDCANEEKMPSLFTNGILQKYVTGEKQMNYVVHFTPDRILQTADYQRWVEAFGPKCLHLIANGTGEALPMTDGVYRQQRMLNEICPEFFPPIFPHDFHGTINQDVDLSTPGGSRRVRTLEKYPMRGRATGNEAASISLTESELQSRIQDNKNIPKAVEEFRAAVASLDTSGSSFPTLTVLGTASAIPMKYRNVSAYWLQLTAEASVMVDCGEGAYGQLKVLHGPEKIDDVMTNLAAVFITHAHLDHMNGLYTIIQRRVEAFRSKGLPYRKLLLVCNRNVRKPLTMYKANFHDLEQFVHIADISLYIRDMSTLSDAERDRLVIELMGQDPVFSEIPWNLRSVKAVHVFHTRMANGFVFETKDEVAEDGTAVLLTHFSSRYVRVPAITDRMIQMGNVSVAMDNMVVPFNKRAIGPLLLPLYRELFEGELAEYKFRLMQRQLVEKDAPPSS
ncbi:BMA-ITSN-1, isoform a [Aphelenchoides fujianensis]|nr:BMA-ITSN-1, isoform a [Aphelenchoides fujianensis]